MPQDSEALAAFARRATERIARLARPGLVGEVPASWRAAAASVARQASGTWRVSLVDGAGFALAVPFREVRLGRNFAKQCGFVLRMLQASRVPDLVGALGKLKCRANVRAAVMSAFFHYFMAHEFVHVEQGLGSDQYRDSDFYMAAVMEADYVADAAGLVLALHAGIPELEPLSRYEVVLVLVAIHIASMHSFQTEAALDPFAFGRLALWYMHFARLNKAGAEPALDAPSFARPWVVAFPRLIGGDDREVTTGLLASRSSAPLAAGSDVVLAFHADDGLFRIHRAALTDGDRTRRLCEAVLGGGFDQVRTELEELLVNNPALVPAPLQPDAPGLEWAAGEVIDLIEAPPSGEPPEHRAERAAAAFTRLAELVGATVPGSPELELLVETARQAVAALTGSAGALPHRRAISLIDQLVLAAGGRA